MRARDDRALAALLRLRPDLALPAPTDLAALAGRLGVRTSTQRAVDALDSYTLRVLENLVLVAGSDDVVDAELPEDAGPALESLFERALIWGGPDRIHLTPSVRDALGPYPAGLGRRAAALFALVPDAALEGPLLTLGLDPQSTKRPGSVLAARVGDPEWVTAALDELDEDERAILDQLAAGPPVATVAPVAANDPTSAPRRLIDRALLVPLDYYRVELPREIGLAVRAAKGTPSGPTPPPMEVVERAPAELDRLGTTAVLDTLRRVEALMSAWAAQPPGVLRAGGLGVRELKRAAKDIDLDEAGVALIAEIAAAAGLVYTTVAPEPVFLPTPEYDDWSASPTARQWATLATTWLGMTRQPSLVGQRGERDRVITALGPDVERGTVPALRRNLLTLLGELAPGDAPRDREAVMSRLHWQQPRRAAGLSASAQAVLDEADVLGITAAGGITGYTRTLLQGSQSEAEHALASALPPPVDHVLVQPDLTVVVPGPPQRDLARELGLLAELESTGGASVYRITERSVRRALDAGRTGEQLAAFVAQRSRTPIPQALTYLIEDAARRHGRLRVGAASAYLRCDDEALLSRVISERSLAPLELRLLAPNVLVSASPIPAVLDALRVAGYAPAAESPDGELITLDAEPPRAPSRPAARLVRTRGVGDPDGQAADIVRRMRSGDALAGGDSRVRMIARDIPGVTSAATMELLRGAVREGRMIWFGCAESDGRTTAHTMQPISLAAGTLRGYEQGRPGLASYPVHRITSLRVLDEDDVDGEATP